jgi:hypothetical protein
VTQTRGDGRDELRRFAADEGARWATSSLATLASQGRATGGWPGTLSEARMRIEACLVLRRATLDSVFGEELARLAYQAARRHWHTYATREPA